MNKTFWPLGLLIFTLSLGGCSPAPQVDPLLDPPLTVQGPLFTSWQSTMPTDVWASDQPGPEALLDHDPATFWIPNPGDENGGSLLFHLKLPFEVTAEDPLWITRARWRAAPKTEGMVTVTLSLGEGFDQETYELRPEADPWEPQALNYAFRASGTAVRVLLTSSAPLADFELGNDEGWFSIDPTPHFTPPEEIQVVVVTGPKTESGDDYVFDLAVSPFDHQPAITYLESDREIAVPGQPANLVSVATQDGGNLLFTGGFRWVWQTSPKRIWTADEGDLPPIERSELSSGRPGPAGLPLWDDGSWVEILFARSETNRSYQVEPLTEATSEAYLHSVGVCPNGSTYEIWYQPEGQGWFFRYRAPQGQGAWTVPIIPYPTVTFSLDGKLISIEGLDRDTSEYVLKVLRTDGSEVRRFSIAEVMGGRAWGGYSTLAPDGRHVVMVADQGPLHLVSLETGNVVREMNPDFVFGYGDLKVAFTPDQATLYVVETRELR